MIKQDTRNILDRHFTGEQLSVVDGSAGIFRCVKLFEGTPYQIIYVDCSDNWKQDDFGPKKLENYLEKYLLKDYYSHSGPLQWNFYYAFISTQTTISKAQHRKADIEKDELYSRKFVWSPAELDSWLTRIDQLSHPVAKKIEQDLSGVWINRLKENKLDAIFLDGSIEQGVTSYMNGKPKIAPADPVGNTKTPSGSNPPISLIRRLTVHQFRDCHNGKHYDFGQVNLLVGVNGSGKTSLLEAIELLLCGRSYRNKNASVDNVEIEALIDGYRKPLLFSQGSLKTYKQRDKEWYNNADQKFNRLDVSFSKFNFYNTDAAYILANPRKSEKEETSIRHAFEAIALGQNVNDLESDMVKYLERFKKEKRGYEKQVNETESEVKKERKLINDIAAITDNPATFLAAIFKDASKKKWVLGTTKKETALQKIFASADAHLKSLSQLLKWSSITTRGELLETLTTYRQALKRYKNIEKDIRIKEVAASKNTAELFSLQELLELLEELTTYYRFKRLGELPGLAKKIETLNAELKNLQRLQQISTEITAANNKITGSKKLKDLNVTCSTKTKNAEVKLSQLTARRELLMQGINQLDRLIKEIKSRGLEFSKLEPNSKECPLCHAEYESAELVRRIQQSKRVIRSSSQIDVLEQNISDIKKEIKLLGEERKILDKYKQAYLILFAGDQYDRSVTVIQSTMKKQLLRLTPIQKELESLRHLTEQAKASGVDEDRFEELQDEADLHGLKIKTVTSFDKQHQQLKRNIASLQKLAQELTKSIRTLSDDKNKLLVGLSISHKQSEQLNSRTGSLEEADKLCEKLLLLKTYRNNVSFGDIKSELEGLKKMLHDYEEMHNRKSSNDLRLQASNKRMAELTQKLAAAKLLLERANTAENVISTLMTEHKKTTYLKQFVEGNKDEILEIFRMIHMPHQFEDLLFDNDGSVQLVRKNKRTSSLSEISTGQRSALSLSVFSALNRKLKNGPNLLMFDDPVANVDDLNVLSYFDYLREVAVKGGRQIFFATANENLAFLFSQKFQFLQKEFVTISLGEKASILFKEDKN